MKLPVIKKTCESFSLDQLRQAESALYEELPLPIEVEGDDEGEKLTHVLAAIFVKELQEQGHEYQSAIREYSRKVRNSIS
jgi:hypothetical protein